MDQAVVAGLGNIYACESLYWAKINPRRTANSLRSTEVSQLVRSIKKVLRTAVAAGGATLDDYRGTEGEMGSFDKSFSVFGRKGLGCPRCDCRTGIQVITLDGRSTFFCPKRQR